MIGLWSLTKQIFMYKNRSPSLLEAHLVYKHTQNLIYQLVTHMNTRNFTVINIYLHLTANLFPAMTTGISLCSKSALWRSCKGKRVLKLPFKPCSMNWQFPVHITGTRATISTLIKQGKKCNQNRRKLYSVNSFPVMTTGISLCSNSTL